MYLEAPAHWYGDLRTADLHTVQVADDGGPAAAGPNTARSDVGDNQNKVGVRYGPRTTGDDSGATQHEQNRSVERQPPRAPVEGRHRGPDRHRGRCAGARVDQAEPSSPLRSASSSWRSAAGFFALVTTTRAGTTLVINPAVSFSFAALLSYGLAPAVVAQLASVAVVYWRPGRSLPRRRREGGAVLRVPVGRGRGDRCDRFRATHEHGSWATLTGALVVIGAIVAWLVTYVGVGLLLELASRGPPRFGVLVKDHLGFLLLSKAALLALGPFLAFAADGHVAFLPLVLVPLAAVQQMARLSAERDRESRLDPADVAAQPHHAPGVL